MVGQGATSNGVLSIRALRQAELPRNGPFRHGAPSGSCSRLELPVLPSTPGRLSANCSVPVLEGKHRSKSEVGAKSKKEIGDSPARSKLSPRRRAPSAQKALKKHQLAFKKHFRQSSSIENARLHMPESTPVRALELLHEAYGGAYVEVGEWIKGDWLDVQDAEANKKYDLEYGEILPQGVTKLFGPDRFDAARSAKRMVELGMGSGKVAVQAFFEVPQLAEIVCVELAHSRFNMAAQALKALVSKHPERFSYEEVEAEDSLERVRLVETGRVLEMRRGDVFETEVEIIRSADIILLNISVPDNMMSRAQELLMHAKNGCRIFSFEDLNYKYAKRWQSQSPFHNLPCNMEPDYYPASWNPSPGEWLWLYEVDHRRRADAAFSLLHSRSLSKDDCYSLFHGLNFSKGRPV